jgi:hypothetical protein
MLMGVVLMALGAAAAPPPNNPEKAPGSACPRIELRTTGQGAVIPPDRGAGHKDREPVFSAATAGDLEIRLSFAPRLSGRRAVLRLHTPKGHLYQELSVALDSNSPGRGLATARLPVSGTLIVNSSLYGRWSLATHLDGGPEACGSPSLFTITP